MDNLNPDDLNLAVMAGDLTLHNLHLKRSAVDKYNLPVEVVEGVSARHYLTNQLVMLIISSYLLSIRKHRPSPRNNSMALISYPTHNNRNFRCLPPRQNETRDICDRHYRCSC